MILRLWPSGEPDRPQIELERQSLTTSDWEELQNDQFPPGIDTLERENIDFVVDDPDAHDWDCYGFSFWTILSNHARAVLWQYARKHLRAFEVRLNTRPYFLLRSDKAYSLDVLDRRKSRIDYLERDPTLIKRIHRYVFKEELIEDPLIFQIPEHGGIFCTPSIRQMILHARLKGFFFEDMSRDVLC